MNHFDLTDDQSMIQETVRKLVDDEVAPRALEFDERRELVRPQLEQLAELGILGVALSEACGGAGLGMLTYAIAVEELAKGCGNTARLVQVQAGPCVCALDGLAAAAEHLEGLATGGVIASWIGPDTGVAVRDGAGGCVLDGRVPVVTGGGEAELLVVAARGAGGEALLFAMPAAAVQREPASPLGFRATAPATVTFDGVRAEPLARGDGAAAAVARGELAAWIGAAALAIGTAQASVAAAKRHAGERIAFGKPLSAQQAVALKLAEGARLTEAARHMLFHAARLADAGADARTAAMAAKIAAIEAAVDAADEAIQIHGGYGFVVEYHVERHYRDVKSLEVLDHGLAWLRDSLAEALLA